VPEIDPDLEAARFFDDSSLRSERPKLVIIAGGICAGKTTVRRQQYGTGFVVLDAAEIFLSLCRGEYLPFPGPLARPLDTIGTAIAKRAIREGRSIVTEILGDQEPMLYSLQDGLAACGYKLEFLYIDCEMEVGLRRNENRGDDNISAYFTQEFHEKWLLRAAVEKLAKGGAIARVS
jgi:hypothetical protein